MVYEAEQDQPKRTVAIKIMRQSIMSRSAARRFSYESKILNKLHHPNIANIYETGIYNPETVLTSEEGIPYFAMELIPEAKNIIEYAKTRELDTRSRLKLFCAVCDGVQHGHQNGVIHRDLKPSNILIGKSSDQPVVIDFGVAKAVGDNLDISTLQTDTGKLIGTVQYMSPEQCDVGNGNRSIDTRCDVYSLGVILYELLCDKLPYDVSDSSLVAAARSVCDARIPHLALPDKKMSRNIGAIILKALSRNPDNRYPTAGELGEDINRYLQGKNIIAYPPSLIDKLAVSIKQHVFLYTIIFCLGVGALIIGGSLLITENLKHRPTRIEWNEKSNSVDLFSYAGDLLKSWPKAQAGVLVNMPKDSTIRKLVVIGHPSTNSITGQSKLTFYDAYHLDKIIANPPLPVRSDNWTSDWTDQIDIIEEDDVFNSNIIKAANIFDGPNDPPGPEIIVVYSHVPEFMNNICIYDLEGNLLYSRWHKGRVYWVEWDEINQQLICEAHRNDWWYKKPGYEDLNLSRNKNIHVLFSLKPELNNILGATVLDYNHQKKDGVVWYKYLTPPATWELFSKTEDIITLETGKDGLFRWGVKYEGISDIEANSQTGITVPFDPGTGDSRTAYPHNGYFFNIPRLPNPKSVRLCDYPPTREEILAAIKLDVEYQDTDDSENISNNDGV